MEEIFTIPTLIGLIIGIGVMLLIIYIDKINKNSKIIAPITLAIQHLLVPPIITFIFVGIWVVYELYNENTKHIHKDADRKTSNYTTCPNCEKEISPSWNFCNYCGHKLK